MALGSGDEERRHSIGADVVEVVGNAKRLGGSGAVAVHGRLPQPAEDHGKDDGQDDREGQQLSFRAALPRWRSRLWLILQDLCRIKRSAGVAIYGRRSPPLDDVTRAGGPQSGARSGGAP